MAASSSKEEKKDKTGKKTSQVKEPSLNMDELRELADLVDERGFTDFEFENEKIRVRLSKMVTISSAQTPGVAQVPPTVSSTATPDTTATEKAETVETDADDGLYKITSPIVGTFYRSPSPDKPPYIKEGDTVSSDTVVCIVEAMKLMNEIQSEVSGEVVKVYLEDAQPVEYGQPLFGIKK